MIWMISRRRRLTNRSAPAGQKSYKSNKSSFVLIRIIRVIRVRKQILWSAYGLMFVCLKQVHCFHLFFLFFICFCKTRSVQSPSSIFKLLA